MTIGHTSIKLVAAVLVVMFQVRATLRTVGATLTVEETLGAVFLGSSDEGDGPEGNVFKASNPDAKPILHRWLQETNIEAYHHNIFLMLAHIGDGTDAKKIETHLKIHYDGFLNPRQGQVTSVQAILWALSTMATRGINEASQILDKMVERDYWQNLKFKWPGEGTVLKHGTTNEIMIQAILAYARAGKPNWQQKARSFLAGVEDPKSISWRLDEARVTQHVREMRSTRGTAVSPELRKELPKLFNQNIDKPGPAGLAAGQKATQ